ncbi:hypothetical protein YC2023_060628 [Brassica napus]
MDKAWVWLPRNSLEYEQGATGFVSSSSRRLGDLVEMFCPCVDCCNVCHQSRGTVFEHLVIRADVQTSENEVYELMRTAFIASDGKTPFEKQNSEDFDGIERPEEDEFRKKLDDSVTPLYPTCQKYNKVAAIMGLYRIKVKSGMSESYFDQLMTLVHDMLPLDNVLPKSTDEMKKFLKVFGFGYDVIHACKNDCILYRKCGVSLLSKM